MATYRHWSVSLWRDPDDVSHCQILSPDKTEWRLISATLCGWRRCFVADKLWLMTRIREEEEDHSNAVVQYWYSTFVCLSCSNIVSKQLNISSYFLQHVVAQSFYLYPTTKNLCKIPTGYLADKRWKGHLTCIVKCRWGMKKIMIFYFSTYILLSLEMIQDRAIVAMECK